VVADQFAPSDQLPDLNPERRPLFHMLPQQIAGRNLRDAVMLRDSFRLSSLACSGWPKQHNWSDVSHHLLCHRTGPNPLLSKSYWHILSILFSGKWSVQGILDRKSTRLNSSHLVISYAVFCLKKKKHK